MGLFHPMMGPFHTVSLPLPGRGFGVVCAGSEKEEHVRHQKNLWNDYDWPMISPNLVQVSPPISENQPPGQN